MASLLARPAHERSTGKGKEGAGDSGPSHGLGRYELERATRPALLLGCEEGEEQTFAREGDGPDWSKPRPEGKGLLIFSKLFFLILFQMGFEFI